MNLKIALVSSVIALGVAGCMTPMATAPAAVTTVGTPEFVAMATSSNTFEIESSRLALQRARDPAVRRFANRMIRDHSLAGRNMMAVVRRAGVPAQGPMLSPRHQQMLASLTTAPNFDAAYVGAQLAAHQEAVGLFSTYSSNGDNPPLVAFARRTLPTLERHLVEIQAVGGSAQTM